MDHYLTERELPNLTPTDLLALQQAVIAASAQLSRQGRAVRYKQSFYLPDEGRMFCIFAAERDDWVRDANEMAGFPFTRIVEVLPIEQTEAAA